MANSARQTLLEYLYVTLFPTITTGGGYNFTVATYERGLRSPNEMSEEEFPALFVASADEKRENTSNVYFKSLISVYIYGVVKSSSGKVQIELDKLIEDVTKALYVDPTQGNRVSYTDVKDIITDEGDKHPHAYFRMEVEFLYTAKGTTP